MNIRSGLPTFMLDADKFGTLTGGRRIWAVAAVLGERDRLAALHGAHLRVSEPLVGRDSFEKDGQAPEMQRVRGQGRRAAPGGRTRWSSRPQRRS